MSSKIEIAFAINSSYIKHATIALFSLLRNNQNHSFAVHILHSDIEHPESSSLSDLTNVFLNFTIDFIKVDSRKFSDLNLNIDHISKETYFRYILADLFDGLDRIIYLDADILVVGDIGELWDFNLKGQYIVGAEDAVILDEDYKRTIGLSDDDLYVNAGVLLMNLKRIRDEDKTLELFNSTKELAGKISYQDQDILNLVFKSDIGALNKKFNFTSRDSIKYKSEYGQARILHFTGSDKPWDRYGEAGRLYTHYLYDRYSDFYNNRGVESASPSSLQLVLLQVYEQFKRICDENKLRYVAAGGTKIGAMRHEGFIPWDDDIDIDMPVEDYVKFVELAPQLLPEGYELKRMFGGMTSTLVDSGTMYTEYYYLGHPEKYTGVFIDIHPVFGTPNEEIERSAFTRRVQELANRIVFHSIAGELDDEGVLRSGEYAEYRQLTQQYDISDSDQVLTVLGQLGEKGLFNKELFLMRREMPFEETFIPVSAGFDEELKLQYGDYSLSAAPKDERERSIHLSRAVLDLNTPYRQYIDDFKGGYIPSISRHLTRQVALGWYGDFTSNRRIYDLEEKLKKSEYQGVKSEVGIKEAARSLVVMIYRKLKGFFTVG